MDLLSHIVVSFAAFTLLGVGFRGAAGLAVLSAVPDLDIFLHIHRSWTHSIVVQGTVFAVIYIVVRRFKPRWRLWVLLGFAGLVTHAILDTFSGYTPILWPLARDSFWIEVSLSGGVGDGLALNPVAALRTIPTEFSYLPYAGGSLVESGGVGVAAVLLAPVVYRLLRRRRRPG